MSKSMIKCHKEQIKALKKQMEIELSLCTSDDEITAIKKSYGKDIAIYESDIDELNSSGELQRSVWVLTRYIRAERVSAY